MEHSLTVNGLSSLDAAAEQFLSATANHRIIAFYAPMGAGKTTFITAICRVLGVKEDAVSSPSFAIVNEYRSGSGEPLFHFDFYRIEKLSEALDLGFYDYIDSGCLCLIEWPENVEELLPEDTLRVSISVGSDGARTISWED